jgi:hypothetical protein
MRRRGVVFVRASLLFAVVTLAGCGAKPAECGVVDANCPNGFICQLAYCIRAGLPDAGCTADGHCSDGG